MYFGYGQIGQFTFVPVGFVIVMATSVALGLVYAVGATRGPEAARRYTNVVAALFVALAAADLVWAAVSGDFVSFLVAYGWGPLVEMWVLALLCVGSLWFMAVSYVNSKRDS